MAFSSWALLATLLAVPVVVGAMWGRASQRPDRPSLLTFWDVVVGATLSIVVLVVQVIAVARVDIWKTFAITYYNTVIALPLIGLVVLVGPSIPGRFRAPRPTKVVVGIAVAALLLAPLGFYTSRIEPYALDVERVEALLPAERTGSSALRIGVISDIQTTSIGSYERDAIARMNAEQPDIVFIAGDLFQGSANQYQTYVDALRALIESIDAPSGVFVVPGDTDDPTDLAELVADAGATYLENDIAEVEVNDRRVAIGGLSLEASLEGDAVIEELAALDEGTIRIALSHRPDWALRHPDAGVDLFVAGHTHGGQLQLPIYGPLQTASRVDRDVAAGGLNQQSGNTIYVTRGVGREQQGAPQVRFLAPPNIGIVDLKAL